MGIQYLSHDFRCVTYNVSFRFGYIEQKLGNLDNKGNGGRKFASYLGSLFFTSP